MTGSGVPITSAGAEMATGMGTNDTVIIVPAYREAEGIQKVLGEIRDSLNSMILVVNRPSGDGTDSLARDTGAIVIEQRGTGKGNAVEEGLSYVRQNFTDVRYIGFVDADCTYPASVMPSMRAILADNPSVGMVIGRRTNLRNNGVKSSAFAVGNKVLTLSHRVLNRVTLGDPLSGLRMVKSEVLQNWRPKSGGFDIECEMNSYVSGSKRLEIVEVPIPYRARVGEKKLRLRHGFTILARMMSLALRGPGRSS
jgi:dolichol-phosphate hexosyltransferase